MPCLVFADGGASLLDIWYSSETGKGDPSFKPAPMPTGRDNLAAFPLGDGRGAAVGGSGSANLNLTTNEIYNPATNTWSTGAPMPTGRRELAAFPLGDGRGAAVGGSTNSVAFRPTNEIYA